MFAGSSGHSDTFVLPDVPSANGIIYRATSGQTLRTQSVDTGVSNAIILFPGQSNNANTGATPYTPTNGSKLDYMSVYDGAIYAATDPALGATQLGSNVACFALRLMDSYAASFSRVIGVPLAVNGTSVSDWETGFCSTRITVALARLRAKGIVAGANVSFAICWGQGESDNTNGTSQSAYTNSLNNIITNVAATGFSGRWFIAKQTYINSTTSSAVRAAQAAVVNHGSGIWAGPDADSLIGSTCNGSNACRLGDNTHFTDDGLISYAAAWKTAMALSGAPF